MESPTKAKVFSIDCLVDSNYATSLSLNDTTLYFKKSNGQPRNIEYAYVFSHHFTSTNVTEKYTGSAVSLNAPASPLSIGNISLKKLIKTSETTKHVQVHFVKLKNASIQHRPTLKSHIFTFESIEQARLFTDKLDDRLNSGISSFI